MAGRSIEDIMRQQAAQRQAQIQQQQAQERALYEQRERARQEYLERARMYEKLSNINPSAASTAAAGGRRAIPTINGHVEFILFNTGEGNHKYVILDFLAETISDIKDTGIEYTVGYDYYFVENTGWVFEFSDGTTLFINDNAEIVETISNEDQTNSWITRTFYLAYFDDGSIKYFDGKEVTTYTGLPSGSILSTSDFTKNSVFVFTTDDTVTTTVYTWTKDNGLTECWSGPSGTSPNRYNGILMNEGCDFFAVYEFNDTLDTWSNIYIFGEDGIEKSSLDLSSIYSLAKLNSGYVNLFGDNKVEAKFWGPTSSYSFNIYDGSNDVWRSATHSKGSNYANNTHLFQNQFDGSQYTSLSNGIVNLVYNTSGSTSSAYNIDKYNYIDVLWSIDGSTHSTYTVNNTGTSTKGVDFNDAGRDGQFSSSLYLGKSIFLPMWLNDSTFRLLCLTATQSVNIAVGSTTNLTGSQGNGLIPGWNVNQRYASFRVGDYFGVWLAYNSSDVYKIYDYTGNLSLSFTMSTGTRLNYSGDVAVITDSSAGIEYFINAGNIGLSPSYATHSYSEMTYYGIKPQYTDGNTVSSKLLSYNEGSFGLSRMYTDEDVFEFNIEDDTIFENYVSDQYVVLKGYGATNWTLYFYDWTATLLATIDTGVSHDTTVYAELVKDRLYFRVTDGSDDTYYYFSPTKSDSITLQNVVGRDQFYDNWAWWMW